MRHCLIALALLALAGAARAQPVAADPSALVAACARAAPMKAVGLEALQKACPDLKESLAAMGLAAALAEGSAEKLTPDSLRTLLDLQRPALRAVPDVSRLEPVLQGLREAPKSRSWWDRFKGWLQRILDAGGRSSRLPWLEQWLEKITPGKLALKIVGYSLMALVVIAAAVILVREIRASNLRFTARSKRRVPGAAPGPDDVEVDRDALRQLPAAQRPRLLFRLVAARLAAAGRLPDARSLTHRELRVRAGLEGEEQATWQELARLAERQVYAHEGASDGDEPVLARAERLWL